MVRRIHEAGIGTRDYTAEEEAEADRMEAAEALKAAKKDIQNKILELEDKITPRRIRDTYDPDADKKAAAIKFITDIEAAIAVERAK